MTKLLAAVAWADGEVSPGEIARIESAAGELRLTQEERRELSRLLASPVPFDESLDLAREVLARSSPQERKSWLTRIREISSADGSVSEPERAAIAAVAEAAVDEAGAEGFVQSLRGIWNRRAEGSAAAAGTTWIRLRERLTGNAASSAKKMDPTLYGRSVVLGALLYRVALSDGSLDDAELQRIAHLVATHMRLSRDEAEVVLDAVCARVSEEMDRQRLCAAFNRFAEMEEREDCLRCLFAVAGADGRLTEGETEELRLIANYLWIDARTFNHIRAEQSAPGR